jgi:hypothetical protein
LNNDVLLLQYQREFIDKVLSYTLEYDHVLYCITNEIFSQYSPKWSEYWASYIRNKATGKGKDIFVTEMFQSHDLDHPQHKASFDHPEVYDFIDISQNSRKFDDEHWEKLQYVRKYIEDHPRPINHTKTYGGPRGEWTDGPNHGIERFWRNIVGGAASTRFHRPPSGIGLNERAKAQIKSARMLLDQINIFDCVPDADHASLAGRSADEAYCTSDGQQFLVYFPDGGTIRLMTGQNHQYQIDWLNIEGSNWNRTIESKGTEIVLKSPHRGQWVALVTPN